MSDIVHTQTYTFSELALDRRILEILEKKGIKSPTPIQHQAIPPAMLGKDIIGIAQTGTGKTWSFGFPMLQSIATKGGRGLIVVPTRELAYQVEESILPFAAALGIGTAVFVGGAPMGRQRAALKRNPRILIATPGRLNDHLEQRTVTLREVNVLVLDEADQMLDMGFKPQIERILKHVPTERQTLLFSATMPSEILKLASAHMKLPLRIEVAPPGTAAANVEQEVFVVRKDEKMRLLESILKECQGSILVFSRTKHGAQKMNKAIRAMGFSAAEIHSNRSLNQRREALDGFKSRKYRILIATDIAARGIDVYDIEVVINFDMPEDAEDYVHRIGRTARAGKTGRAISFATPDQTGSIRKIERLIRGVLPRKKLPLTLPPHRAAAPSSILDRRDESMSHDDQHQNTFNPRSSYRPQKQRRGGFQRNKPRGKRW